MKIHLLVGSGGGVPSSNPPDDPDENIRLGDIVVGWSGKTGTPGVVQWDFVRYLSGGETEPLSFLDKPDLRLRNALGIMLSNREMGEDPFHEQLTKLEGLEDKFSYPDPQTDRLLSSTYDHPRTEPMSFDCNKCDAAQLIERKLRKSQDPQFHQGTILSGNSVMQDARMRDHVSRTFYNGNCFEMERAWCE